MAIDRDIADNWLNLYSIGGRRFSRATAGRNYVRAAKKIYQENNYNKDDSVLIIHAGFGWTGEALVKLGNHTPSQITMVEGSSFIHSVKDNIDEETGSKWGIYYIQMPSAPIFAITYDHVIIDNPGVIWMSDAAIANQLPNLNYTKSLSVVLNARMVVDGVPEPLPGEEGSQLASGYNWKTVADWKPYFPNNTLLVACDGSASVRV